MVDAARVLDALGDPTRRAVFEHLRDRPLPVVELASRLPVSRPAVSRHLRVLESAGLVRGRAVGRNRLYSVDRTGLHAVQLWLTTFWDDVLTSFAEHVETGQQVGSVQRVESRARIGAGPLDHLSTTDQEGKPR